MEKKYEADEIEHEQIKVQPQLAKEETNKELDDLTEELTKDIGEELFETL